VPLPDTVVFAHNGALLQLPERTQVGQEKYQEPDKQLLVVEDPVYPELHEYVRVSPSVMPLPEIVAFAHNGALPQSTLLIVAQPTREKHIIIKINFFILENRVLSTYSYRLNNPKMNRPHTFHSHLSA